MRHTNLLAQVLSWLAVMFAMLVVAVVMAAPYFVSVISNIGRRPVIYRRAPAPRRRLAPPRRVGA